MKNKISSLPFAANLILFASVFIGSIYMPSDPDLGWHLKYGKYFFDNWQVLRTNPYSQLMPNFHWNNSSWLTDLFTYQFFNHGGFVGLSIAAAVVITATFYFMGKAAKLNLFEKALIFPVVFYFVSSVNSISFRGQILSLLLLSILYFILSKYEENKKTSLILIPLFMLWGNLHGEYILGLAIFAIWIFLYIVKEIVLNYKFKIKKLAADNKFLITSFFGSLVALLINPFGFGAYEEALKHFDNPLQKSITEFLAPADFSAVWWHLLFCMIVMTLGAVLLGLSRKHWDKIPFYGPSVVLLLLTFWIRRYAWPFYYSSIFLLQPVAHFFEPDNKEDAKKAGFIIAVLFLFLTIYVKHTTNFKDYNWKNYCSATVACSADAAQFVIDHKLNNNKLLTMYDYGGYLMWNYPQIKPTIDGRMHLWRDEKGFSAFAYYYPIEQNTTSDIQTAQYNAVLVSRGKPIYKRLLALSRQNLWKEVYEDKNSAVFIRNK